MSQPTLGRVLAGRYRLKDIIARGGMATVWLGHDELLGRRVAVKTLHPHLTDDDALRGRFRQEAVAAAALSHPNIVATFDTGDDDGTAFIVMELVEGPSLREHLDHRKALTPAEACAIVHQVAGALEHAHRQGIVHRDVKPANVLVPPDGPVKVTDFGIAKAAGGGEYTRTGTVVGTARYLSPEQVQGLPTDARSDVYSLGLVLYEMLAGRPAYSGDSEVATALARLTGPPPPLATLRPDVGGAITSVLDQALQPNPDHRIPSAAAFDEALRAAEAGQSLAPRGPDRRQAGASSHARARGPRADTAMPTTEGFSPHPRSRARRPVRLALFLLFLAALGTTAGLVTALIVRDRRSTGNGSSSAPEIAEIRDFDPFGDGTENPDTVDLAIDGDPSTAWTSETYTTRDVGGKPGVGLVLVLTRATSISGIEIDGEPRADVEVFVADTAGTGLDAWGSPRAGTTSLDSPTVLSFDRPVRGGAVLVWFTRTPPSGRIVVNELRAS